MANDGDSVLLTFELQDRREHWIRVVEARDAAAYADIVTEDIVWVPPGQNPILGRAAFEAWVRPFFASFEYRFSIEPLVIIEAETHACERARFHSHMRQDGSSTFHEHSGTCIIFWRREPDGAWRIERYVDETELEAS